MTLRGTVKQVVLTQGYVAQVDDDDFERVSQFTWHAKVVRRKDGSIQQVYAWRNVRKPDGTRTGQKMHRFILGVTDPAIGVDHRDRDGLNNQRDNLRIATASQNQCNRPAAAHNAAGYKGVARQGGKYRAQIRLHGRKRHLGYFNTPRNAADAYDAAAIQLHGEFALTNKQERSAAEFQNQQ